MVKICQTGLLILNFEIIPKKCIFRFLPKISAGYAWSLNFFFANFQILGPLGCQGWVVIPQNVRESQNHCTLVGMDPNGGGSLGRPGMDPTEVVDFPHLTRDRFKGLGVSRAKVFHRSNHMYELKHFGMVWQRRIRERFCGSHREPHFY